MHILVVADHGWINGGQAKVAIESALGLVQRGHHVTFLAAVGPIDSRLARAGVETICLNQNDIDSAPSKLGFVGQYMWNAAAAQMLRKCLATMDPANSIVHVHAWAKAISPSIGPVLNSSPVACVYTMHEFFLVCPTGGFYDYPRGETCHRTPMSMACIKTNCDQRSYARKLMRVARQVLVSTGGVLKAFRHIVFISDLQHEAASPYLPGDAKVNRISNPVDATDIGPKERAGSYFLFVGRVSREKGVEHFCEAAVRAGLVPVIAGDGPMLDELKTRFPQGRYLGWQKPAEIPQLLRDARALVFPSVWYEGQPLTVYEALAMGTPVIVSDACAGREAVVDGQNGFVFRSADADSLAQAITHMQDDEVADRVTREAHARYWTSPLTLDVHLDKIETLYDQMLSEKRSAIANGVLALESA